MLYGEFLKGTKAKETNRTYSQYEAIEKIYNDCEFMTKEEAYKIWKQTYGKQEKINKEKILSNIKKLSEYIGKDFEEKTFEDFAIERELIGWGKAVAETNEPQGGWNIEITLHDVTYRLQKYSEINYHSLFEMVILFEGKEYKTNLTYQFGDWIVRHNVYNII